MDTLELAFTTPSSALCVDDNHDAADTMATLLRTLGLTAAACYDGPAALERAGADWPDVCLVDLHMPGMPGDELGRELRARAAADGRPLVLVAVTAWGDAASRARTAAAGFDYHLVKPADPQQLVGLAYALWNAAEPIRAGGDGGRR